jgi:AraC-like DNA-binding protein
MTFSSMIQGCRSRCPSGERVQCDRREACKPVDWKRAFAFAGAGRTRPGAERPGSEAAFPAFLGQLAEALGWDEGRRRSPARREDARKPFRTKVERALEPLLAGGKIGMDRIARELGFSRQTLYRRLQEEGTTFEQVLDGLRRRLAIRYIDRDGLGVKQTAYLLGFSEPASFSRAFKRWTGRSPSARS